MADLDGGGRLHYLVGWSLPIPSHPRPLLQAPEVRLLMARKMLTLKGRKRRSHGIASRRFDRAAEKAAQNLARQVTYAGRTQTN